MQVNFDARGALLMAKRSSSLARAASELAAFGDMDPQMASDCGVEIASLEARTILLSGAPARVATLAAAASRSNQPLSLSVTDVESISRLEAVVALGSSRIALKMAALDAEASQAPAAQLGNLMGLATGAIGLYKAIF